MLAPLSGYHAYILQVRQLMTLTNDPAVLAQYQAQIDLVMSWEPYDIDYQEPVSPGVPGVTPIVPVLTNSNGPENSTDSKVKLDYLRPLLERAAKAANVPFDVLAAAMLAEGRGWSIHDLAGIGGLAQCGQVEFEEERRRHPEFFPPDMVWNSPEGQIMALAFRLSDNRQFNTGGTWYGALARYNGGEYANGGLNSPDYLEKFQIFLDGIRIGGALPS